MNWEDMPIVSKDEVLAFDQVQLREARPGEVEQIELEPFCVRDFIPPQFVADLSDKNFSLSFRKTQNIHATYLVQRRDVMLFGTSNLVSSDGCWSCEDRRNRAVHLQYMMYDFFKRVFPGETPKVSGVGKIPMISTTELAENQSVRWIEEPVFLATAIEPATWGRWVANIMPRVRHYLTHGQGRKFLCHANRPWERHTLTTLGVPEDQIIHHEPGCTYLCRDVLHIELEGPVLPISLGERGVLSDFVDKNQVQTSFGEKLFVSRLSASRRLPDYRTLLNEEEAIDFYSQRRFSIIEPELLSLPEQMSAFRSAETIVVVGGSAMFNAAFCVPGTRVVTIESSDSYIQTHMEYLSALDLNYGVIFGQQDPKDSRTLHARWTLDVQKSWDAIEAHWPGIAT